MTWEGLGPRVAAGLLLAALVLALVLVLLRPIARRAVVGFGALWARALARSRRALPVREALAFLLFAASLAALAGGIAGPKIDPAPPRRVAIVLDASASMGARDAQGRRRFDLARLAAARIARAQRPGDALAIVRSSATAEVVSPFELARLDVDDAAGDLGAAIAQAESFLRAGDPGASRRLVVLSDRAEEAASDDPSIEVDRLAIGEPGESLAISSLGVSAGGASEGGLEIRVSVTSFAASAASTDLVLHTDRFRLGGAKLSIAPGATETRLFHVDGLPPGASFVQASLDGTAFASGAADALAADDHRAAWAPDAGPISVALVTRGDRYLEGALAVQGGVRTRVVAPGSPLPPADVVIADGVDLAPPRGVRGFLRIGAHGGPVVKAPVLTAWNGRHPATAEVSLDDLTLAEASVLPAGPGDVVLAATQEGPIALARERDGVREIEIGFDPSRSDFPLRLGYPVFVGRAVRWLAGRIGDETPPLEASAGRVLELPPGDADLEAIAGDPGDARIFGSGASGRLGGGASGRPGSGASGPGGGARRLETSRAGLFRAGPVRIEVSPDPDESRLAVANPAAGEPALPAWVAQAAPVPPKPWGPLLFGAGAALLALRSLLA